jgi:hypothetical protein
MNNTRHASTSSKIRHAMTQWLLPLYKWVGVGHPKASLTVMFLIGGLIFGGMWYLTGREYQESLKRPQLPPESALPIQPSQPPPNNQKDVPPKKERRLAAIEQPLPRILSEEQIASLTTNLQLAAGNAVFLRVVTGDDAETQQLGKQIAGAFKNAKWVVTEVINLSWSIGVIGEPDVSELNQEAGLICTAPTLDSDLIRRTRSAFNRARLPCLWAKDEVYDDSGKPYPLGILIRQTKKN